jgi:hypothetical protein
MRHHPLNPKQQQEINRIGQTSHFNLAPPPTSWDEVTKRPHYVSLTNFIDQTDWTYSDLDIVDRREIQCLADEDVWCYIVQSDIRLDQPGHLSAVTVAKAIQYGVNLLGVFIEIYLGQNQQLGKDTETSFGKMADAALELASRTFASCPSEHNWYEHFQLLIEHPVINAGVQIAAWNQYRLPDPLLE